MDFDLSDEQSLLRQTVTRLLADKYAFESRCRYEKSVTGWSEELWSDYAEMGLLALPFAEADGGLGGGDVERMIVCEAMGAALVLEPYFATAILGGALLRHAGSDAQRARLVPPIAEGALKLAFAYLERQSRYDLGDVLTRAEAVAGGSHRITGHKVLVVHGGSADKIFVTAATGAAMDGKAPVGLFLVDAKAPGVTMTEYLTQDGLRAADISFDGVMVGPDDTYGRPGRALPLVQRAVEDAIAALCAEALGAMTVMLDATVAYLKVRKQFGTPLSRFQALQHRAAEMYIAVEQARSMTVFATMMLGSADDEARTQAVRAAKVAIGREGRFVGENAIQLHGGIGMTMENAVAHYFKRVTMIDLVFGDADTHLAALADAGARLS